MKAPTKSAGRLEILLRKQESLRADILAERSQQQRRLEREASRLAAIIGAALMRAATSSQSLKLMLTQVLRSAELSESDRNFLTRKEWY